MPLSSLASRDGAVLSLHVVAKGSDMGAMLGLGVGVLAAAGAWAWKGRNPALTLLRTCEWGLALGYVAGVLMLGAKAVRDESMTQDGVADRVYRLENSNTKFSAKLDDKFVLGGAVGAIATLAAPDIIVAPNKDEEEPLTTWERISAGFATGGAVGFALGGGAKILRKMVTKQLEMV